MPFKSIENSIIFKTLFFVSIHLFSIYAYGQFELGAEIRPRFEYRDGYRTLSEPNEKGVGLVTQRTRLNARFKDKSGIQTYISFQDLRTWGEFDSDSFESGVGLYEGWIQFPLMDQVSIKIGRQEIEYHDSRIVSSNDWRLQGRSHDGAMLIYNSPDSSFTVNVTGAINNERQVLFQDLYRPDSYKNMVMIWVNKKLANTDASLLFFDNGYQLADTSINHFRTYGVFISQKLGDISITGSYYAQSGKDGLDRDVSSSMLTMHAAILINKKFTFNPGFDILSGTSAGDLLNPAFNGNNTFVPIFTRRHRHFGEQDMFYAGGIEVVPGLTDIFIKTSYKFNKDLTAKLNGHYFQTARKFLDESGGVVDSKYLGIEFDSALEYQYSPDLKIKFGYTHFLPTKAMEILKGRGDSGEIAHFSYLQLTYKPTFFKSSSYK